MYILQIVNPVYNEDIPAIELQSKSDNANNNISNGITDQQCINATVDIESGPAKPEGKNGTTNSTNGNVLSPNSGLKGTEVYIFLFMVPVIIY